MMEEKTRVLVVDDEKVVREGCHRVLSQNQYDVLGAENGQEAVDTLESKKVDVILLDLRMPGMSGEDVLEHSNSNYPDIPVIIITGHGTVDTAVECMKKGAYDFITKPFQVDQFIITVRRAAEKRSLELKARQFQEQNEKNLYDLALEKSRLKAIINCMANGIMVTNLNLEVVLHNPALMRLMEISQEVSPPIPLRHVINHEDFEESLKRIQNDPSAENETISQEIDVGKNTLRAISAPAAGPEGSVAGSVTVFEDITEFKQLDRMKSDFVNMVVHELRSPLVSVKQQHNVILEGLAGELNEKQQGLISKGATKIDSLLELINDLLDIAKMEQGRSVQHLVPTDIEQILADTIGMLESRANEQGIALNYSCEDLKPVQADPKGMEEIFNNLLTNAINYSPGGGEVSVSARGLGEYIEIRVSDTGVGIPQEELPKIFDKFYRVKSPKTREVMGTGLGLAIVKTAVEAQRGKIDVDSEPGKGTTFRILLPAIKE